MTTREDASRALLRYCHSPRSQRLRLCSTHRSQTRLGPTESHSCMHPTYMHMPLLIYFANIALESHAWASSPGKARRAERENFNHHSTKRWTDPPTKPGSVVFWYYACVLLRHSMWFVYPETQPPYNRHAIQGLVCGEDASMSCLGA